MHNLSPAEKKAQVLQFGRIGLCNSDIAAVLGIDEEEVSGEAELPQSVAIGNGEILTALYNMASSSRNAAAAIFLAKTRCYSRTREGNDPNPPSSEKKTPKPIERKPLEGFRVELDNEAPNDGL